MGIDVAGQAIGILCVKAGVMGLVVTLAAVGDQPVLRMALTAVDAPVFRRSLGPKAVDGVMTSGTDLGIHRRGKGDLQRHVDGMALGAALLALLLIMGFVAFEAGRDVAVLLVVAHGAFLLGVSAGVLGQLARLLAVAVTT